MREVEIDAVPLDRLAMLLDADRAARLAELAARAKALLNGRTIWNVNTTASGGGVAEMLQSLLGYTRGAQVDTRWVVVAGTPDFFRITKRLHNRLHGVPGDGGPMGDAERLMYEHVLAENLLHLRATVRAGDIVLLHDPQTAGLAQGLCDMGAHPVWRCHVGRDDANEHTEEAWAFLRPYVASSEAAVFSRRVYAPEWVAPNRVWVIPPSLDPFSAKNRALDRADLEASLGQAGLVRFPQVRGASSSYDATAHAARFAVTRDYSRGARCRWTPGSSCRSVDGTISKTWPACSPGSRATWPTFPTTSISCSSGPRPPVSATTLKGPASWRNAERSGGRSRWTRSAVCISAASPWTTSMRTPISSTRCSATPQLPSRRASWRDSVSP